MFKNLTKDTAELILTSILSDVKTNRAPVLSHQTLALIYGEALKMGLDVSGLDWACPK